MRSEPETRYVKSGDAHIAYQVVGDGPVDLIIVRGYISHVEVAWESPALASFYRRLASFCRLILFDKRGTGLSDRVPEDRLPTLEQRMDDVRAVMEAVGSDRAALFGASEGGPMCLLFAATYPERTLGLLLWGCFAHYDWRRSFIGRYWGGDTVDDALDRLEREWGDGGDLAAMAPSVAGDDAARRAWGRAQRLAATPTAARALLRMMLDVDVRPLLPAIRVPVVILHRVGDVAVDVSHSRYMADHIPGARYVELPGSDHLPWIGDTESLVAEIQELVTGTRPEPEPDRVVATVLFVDAPYEVVRSNVARFRGAMLAARGDSLGASFDGPARAIRCAEAIVAESTACGVAGRAGLHTGECEPHGSEFAGVAVDVAAEILARASAGEVLVSRTVADLVAGANIAFADRGSHSLAPVHDSWQLLATSPGRAPSQLEPARVFRREGEYWTVAFGGKVVRMRDAKGLGYLARLLRHPHREFHVLDLLAGDAQRGDDASREGDLVVAPADAGAMLDVAAKRVYRERIVELEAEIEQARRWNDPERGARAKAELDALTNELAVALGLGGRDRRAASDSERARVSVSKAVHSAVRRLDDQHPELGRHLSLAVHTGTFCTYAPDAMVSVTWDA
ncbi:alpha/beta fold hydrolase [Solirubrobacter ginsenosidimutans]|uniref:Alpha/beta fold hydrolase n=1 Tax=Solirubrobacter ginsenosidimutans TaxID=490573 RepID=A0A9X3MTD9_9ACTN|nr:alpha/beta fold hydrolase [Solirubrobacter ginsenosidimutans]MDA0160895.1 alpha/beta fold hydrolase [Solirubrobacter ginsenosidimutans]